MRLENVENNLGAFAELQAGFDTMNIGQPGIAPKISGRIR